MWELRNKILVFWVQISSKYWLSADPKTILLTDSRLAKKLEKIRKNHQNIGNSRYFGEISKLYLTRACAGIFEKISIKYR